MVFIRFKPDTSIYKTILRIKELKANETVFLDDNADNIKGALSTGISALHVTEQQHLLEQLKHA